MITNWAHLEQYRWQNSPLGDSPVGATYGAFRILRGKTMLRIIAVDGQETGWEHVSVTVAYKVGGKWKERMPTWGEMSEIKDLFWHDFECVVQFHPPKSEHVNNHRFCLHLWRAVANEFPMPPSILVGIKELGTLDAHSQK